MKVILLDNIPHVGKKYDVKEVANGYALNHLIPKRLVEPATKNSIMQIERKRVEEDAKKRIREDLLLKNIEDIKNTKIKISAKANTKGHLFAGIHKTKLLSEIKKQTGLDFDEEHLLLKEPVKEVGEHKLSFKVGDKEVTFLIEITAQ